MGNLHMKARLTARTLFPQRNWFPIEAWDDIYYDQAFRLMKTSDEELEAQRIASCDAAGPLFSIVVPLFETPADYLQDMVESVLAQTYPRFELILVNASPEIGELCAQIEEYAAKDQRIKPIALDENHGITENTNAGIAVATGDFVCFIDHDDWIEPDTLFEYAAAVSERPDIDLLYCDEDLAEKGKGTWRFIHPLFKQDYSPELLLCKNYIIHFLAVRKSIVDALPVPDSVFDGAQDYNMTLAASERARRVRHVAKVLYHFRVSDKSTAANPAAKPYRIRAARKSIQGHLERTGTQGRILGSKVSGSHTIWFSPDENKKASLVVAGKAVCDASDEVELFQPFLETFAQVNSHENVEVLLVGGRQETASSLPNIARFIEAPEASTLYGRFNAGAREATGDALMFLDADCVFATPEPLEQLVGLLSRKGVGIVAPKTLFADYSVKSYGIGVSGEGIVPLYRGYPIEYPSYLSVLYAHQNTSAVGYQGLTIARPLFEVLGGFDESFESEIASVDLCRKAIERGCRIALSCSVELLTGETPPAKPFAERGPLPGFPTDDIERFFEKWPHVREESDHYRSPFLDLRSSYPVMRA